MLMRHIILINLIDAIMYHDKNLKKTEFFRSIKKFVRKVSHYQIIIQINFFQQNYMDYYIFLN